MSELAFLTGSAIEAGGSCPYMYDSRERGTVVERIIPPGSTAEKLSVAKADLHLLGIPGSLKTLRYPPLSHRVSILYHSLNRSVFVTLFSKSCPSTVQTVARRQSWSLRTTTPSLVMNAAWSMFSLRVCLIYSRNMHPPSSTTILTQMLPAGIPA